MNGTKSCAVYTLVYKMRMDFFYCFMMYDGSRDTPRDPRKESFPPIVWDSSSVIISQNTGYVSIVQQYERQYTLKGQSNEIFDFRFSTWISFPQVPDYTIRAVSNFFRKFVEIFGAQGAPPLSLTPVANGKNLSNRKIFIISFRHLWVVELAYSKIRNGSNLILWGWGETDSSKNQKQKIS
jgi:hypothetical protein